MKRTDITDIWPDATKEQIDRIMDLNGADINRARGDLENLRVQLSNAQNEIEQLKLQPTAPADQELKEKLQAANKELEALKASNALRDLRAKVSKETGVPADLLTAETEDALKTQAEAIKAYAKPRGYPKVPDGGEVRPGGATATRDQFADWLEQSLK